MKETISKPEILAPAGNFMSAIYAFKGGADAIYFGLKNFSARKFAENISINDLLKLKKYALENNKRIYTTINTIILDKELEELIRTLILLNEIKVDAIIIQDMGVYQILKDYFPNIKIHASTQMCAINDLAIKKLIDLKFERVILPRELTFEEIKTLKESNPKIEFEVFIHGALCYSYSGLCLASGKILGRSGNRGECAQLCRNDYLKNNIKGYYFSCNDNFLGVDILKLKEIGIKSFKIEGRMKSPEYVYNVSKYYRYIIDNENSIDTKTLLDLEKNIKLTFSRKPSKGHLYKTEHLTLIDNKYPTHTGILLGKVHSTFKFSFKIRTFEDLGLRDGLMFFKDNDPLNPIRFSIKKMHRNGNSIKISKINEDIEIFNEELPKIDQEIYLISRRTLDLPNINQASYHDYKIKKDILISLNDNININYSFNDNNYHFSEKTVIDEAKGQLNFKDKLNEIFSETKDSIFKCEISELKNNTNFKNIFIPPAQLKKIKNDFYTKLNETFDDYIHERANFILNTYNPFKIENKINFKRSDMIEAGEIIPFAKEDLSMLKTLNGYTIIPLNPIKPSFDKIINEILANPKSKYLIGINNISHFKYIEYFNTCDNVFYFIDFYFYVANSACLHFILENIKNKLLFIFTYIEDKTNIDEDFNPPLFISKICFNNGEFELIHNKNKYSVNERNGSLYVFKKIS